MEKKAPRWVEMSPAEWKARLAAEGKRRPFSDDLWPFDLYIYVVAPLGILALVAGLVLFSIKVSDYRQPNYPLPPHEPKVYQSPYK